MLDLGLEPTQSITPQQACDVSAPAIIIFKLSSNIFQVSTHTSFCLYTKEESVEI